MASANKRINEYNAGLSPELKALKWKALMKSPFYFYRGTCHLFAHDFTRLYNEKPKVTSWICGDLHMENFGSYKGENRQVYFDLNDFDESLLTTPETEVARFLTSIIIAAAQMKVAAIGLHKTLHDITLAYVTTLITGKALMLEQEVAHGEFKKYFEKVATLDRDALINKHTTRTKGNGALQLKTGDGHLQEIDQKTKNKVYNGLTPLLNKGKFEHLVFEDAAYRIAGTGSLGQTRYCVLCYNKKKGKHYLIDVKQSKVSCYNGLVKTKQPLFKNQAERILAVGNLLQFNSPAFTATAKIDEAYYVVRELQRQEDKMALEAFGHDFGKLSAVAREMAVLMAYSHIRSSGHLGSSTADDLRRFAEKKQWQKDIIELSGVLAKKNQKYYNEFVKAEGPAPKAVKAAKQK